MSTKFTFVTPQVIIARNAGALYGVEVGYTNMASYVSQAGNNTDSFLNTVYTNSVGQTSTAVVASVLVENLGITGDATAIAINYVKGQLDAVDYTARGALIDDILSMFSGLTADPVFGSFATAFNNKVTNAVTYAQVSGNGDGTFASVSSTTVINQTFTLTKSVDAITGTSGNDTINAVLDGADSTLTALDVIDGGAGTDTLNILEVQAAALPGGLTISNVENAVVRSAGAATVDSTTWTGLTSLKSTQSTTAGLTAATTTDIEVSGATDAITINGGKNTVVTDATAAKNITVGATTVGAGSVTVTDSNQTTGAIAIDGGTDVTVTASKATTGTVKIGDTTAGAVAADMPSGAVTLTTTGAAYTAADAAATRGQIDIVGGTTVTVSQTATSDSSAAATDTSNIGNEVTQSDINVTGNASTTSVTVSQSAAVTAVEGVAATAGVNQVDKVTFVAMAATETITVGGLTFTASKTLTAAEAASAFANLTAGATQGSAPAGNGVYSGTFGAYSTGAVTTASGVSSVNATASTAATGNTPIAVSDAAAAGNVASTNTAAGVTAVTAVTGVMGVVGGAVIIEGNITGTDVLATASVDGYGAGSSIDSDALTSLTLANSKADFDVDNTVATTLALSLNNIGTGSSLDIGSTYTTLNVTAAGANSDVTLVAGGVQTLTVAGDKSVDLTGATLTALKTVTVSGSAGLTIDASGANVTAVNTAATTGTVTATVDASKATYTGGAGVDNVTLSSTTVSKAVNTGAGDDKVTLASGTTSLTEAIVAGDGTDTLVMVVADAATAAVSSVFETKIDGFEKLSLGAVAAATTVDLSNMDDINYVISAGGAAVKEVFTATFTADATSDSSNGHITFDGVDFMNVVDGMTAAQVAAAFTTFYNAQAGVNWVAVDNTDGTVTFTAKVAGAVTDVVSGDFGPHGSTDVTVTAAAPTTQGAAASGSLTLDNMANNGTLELTGASNTVTVTMTDATGTADSFNIVTKVDAADLSFGTVAVAGVETVNITATDTTPVNTTTGAATISKATLTVSDSAVKSVVVTGNSDLDLTAAGTSLTSVNASALTGKLTFSSAVNSAVVTGGSAADTLTATGNSQTLNGGAGADTLVVTGDLATLSGGAGNDVFNIGNATTNVNSYATITDLAAGDVIKFSAGASDFVSAKVTLGDTAVFQDLANAAIANSDAGDVAWFQFSGNTYVIENVSNNASAFVNNTDIIVKITGTVDLSTASFSSSADSLYIA